MLKKVSLEIKPNGKVLLKSFDDVVEINEKLSFMLQQSFNFITPKLRENIPSNFKDISEKIMDMYAEAIPYKDIFGPWKHLDKESIKNSTIEYERGTVLFITQHSGGSLRRILETIIREGKVDKLLDIDPLGKPRANAVKRLSEGEGIYRITESDFSQELAIIGSMQDDAIIWGPPGTGKSQTIANIITNILANDKTAIVTSEKKAALDVIKKRMGKLSKYMFFGLTDKNPDKEEFYKTFKDFAAMITENPKKQDYEAISMLDKVEWDFMELNKKLGNEDVDALIKTREYIMMNSNRTFSKAKSELKNILTFPEGMEALQDIGIENIDKLPIELNLEKKGIIKKQFPKNVRDFMSQVIYERDKYEFNDDMLRVFSKIINFENVSNLNNYRRIEEKYSTLKYEFNSDEDFIDALIADKLRKKIKELRKDQKWAEKINVFLKHCNASAFRTPYKFIEMHRKTIQEIYPILVSTPDMLANTINFLEEYDYAIFDEASQMHVEKSLPIISIAKKSIIAGDTQQMRPSTFFLIRDNSTEIFEEAEEQAESLLDYAYRKGFGKQREYLLSKNYRSQSSDLMIFSSNEYYGGQLSVVDNANIKFGSSAIEVKNVGGEWKNSSNQAEADAIIKKANNIIDEFNSMIILGLNASQKTLIEQKIYSAGGNYEKLIAGLEDGKLKLRNLENIQGDEADVVLISVGYDASASLSSTYVARSEGRNALNVAISRAIYKMYIYKSIAADEVKLTAKNKSISTFKRWLKYLDQTGLQRKHSFLDSMKNEDESSANVEKVTKYKSDFEKSVLEEIREYIKKEGDKFDVKDKHPIGTYILDQVIVEKKTQKVKLGIQVHNYKTFDSFEDEIKNIDWERFVRARDYNILKITPILWNARKEDILENIKKIIKK